MGVAGKIPLYVPYLDKSDEEAVSERIREKWIVGDGPKCREFEKEFADYLGVKYVLLTTSCTAALDLAFMALELEKGEVIIPDYTFTSSALAPMMNGLDIRLCDVEYRTANMDPELIEDCITEKTKAIVSVDYAGYPCRIDRILEIARKHALTVVHDAAQSCGSKYNGEYAGTQANLSCFSFHATKNLSTGEGGCLVTNDDELAERAYVLRDKGTNKRSFIDQKDLGYYEYQMLGNSYVQSDILGALALSQLKKLDWMNRQRSEHATYLSNGLSGIKDLELPGLDADVESNWHLYSVRVPEDRLLEFRDELNNEGVGCNTHYHPLHINSLYKDLGYNENNFPNATRVFRTLLRLPMYPQLTREELDRIVEAVWKVARRVF